MLFPFLHLLEWFVIYIPIIFDTDVGGVLERCRRHALDLSPVNLDRIQSWVDQGRLDASRTITVKELVESRCIHGVKDGVKLLARVSSFFLLLLQRYTYEGRASFAFVLILFWGRLFLFLKKKGS
jgi:hypothetical protein